MFKGINHVVTILPSQTLTYTSPTTSFDTFMIPSAIADRPPQLPTTAFLSCAYLKKTNESLISSITNSKFSDLSFEKCTLLLIFV